jgi:hypothetical protein
MFEIFFVTGLLAFVLPVAVLGGMAYAFIWLVSAVLKTAGAVVGIVLAVVFCGLAVVVAMLLAIFSLPFLVFL